MKIKLSSLTPALQQEVLDQCCRNTRVANHSYLIGMGPNGRDPYVDGIVAPILFCMILTKITGFKVQVRDPNSVRFDQSADIGSIQVSMGGILTTFAKALKGAIMEHPEAFERKGQGAYRVNVSVGSIYEQGMK